MLFNCRIHCLLFLGSTSLYSFINKPKKLILSCSTFIQPVVYVLCNVKICIVTIICYYWYFVHWLLLELLIRTTLTFLFNFSLFLYVAYYACCRSVLFTHVQICFIYVLLVFIVLYLFIWLFTVSTLNYNCCSNVTLYLVSPWLLALFLYISFCSHNLYILYI